MNNFLIREKVTKEEFGPTWRTTTGLNSDGKLCFIWHNIKHAFSGQINIEITDEVCDWEKAWSMAKEGFKLVKQI